MEFNPAWFQRDLQHARAQYSYAQIYYKTQKDKFLNDLVNIQPELYNKLALKTSEEITLDLQEAIGNSQISDKLFKDFYNKIQNLATEVIEGERGQDIISTINSKEKGKQELKAYTKRVSELLDKVIVNELQGQIQKLFLETYKNDAPSINSITALFKRELVSQTKGLSHTSESLKGYTNYYGGVVKEGLLVDAFNQWAIGVARQSGGISDKSGKETPFDIVLFGNKQASNMTTEDFELIVKQMSEFNKTTSANMEIPAELISFYGGQSKSWWLPKIIDPLFTTSSKVNQFAEVGHRKQLYNSLGFNNPHMDYERGWHASARKLADNIREVIGYANIFYSTGGNRFIWTHELIEKFAKAHYYLTFYYQVNSKNQEYTYPARPDALVVWMQPRYRFKRKS